VTDNDRADRVLERLLAVEWDDVEGALRHWASRARLMQEYLGRTAWWAQTLGPLPQNRWPFANLAKAVDPSTRADPAQVALLIRTAGDGLYAERLRYTVECAMRWAALGDLPKERFPELDPDPFEPLLLLLERGGGFRVHSGFMELDYASVPYGELVERVAQPPLAIDEATLDALDEAHKEF
jgi:hypothetical protein